MEDILFIFLVSLALSLIVSEMFHRLKLPKVVGQIIAGMVLGIPLVSAYLVSSAASGFISSLSELGIIFLLLLTGLEIDYKQIIRQSRAEFLIAFFGAVIPFLLGFGLMKLLGYPDVVALVLGASLSLTAEGTTAKALIDLNVLKTRVGTLLIGAGMIDDVFEVLFLAVVLLLVHQSALQSLSLFPVALLAFIAFCFVAIKLFPKLVSFFRTDPTAVNYATLAIIAGVGIAWVSGLLGLGPILGALVAGIIIQVSVHSHKIELEMVRNLKMISFAVVVPFFFILVGLNFSFGSFLLNPLLFLLILAVAVLGKIVGTIVTKPFSGLSMKQLLLVGWGMNSRGAVELVIAEIARQGIPNFPMEVYSAIVFMAVITTLIFPIQLQAALKKDPKIME